MVIENIIVHFSIDNHLNSKKEIKIFNTKTIEVFLAIAHYFKLLYIWIK